MDFFTLYEYTSCLGLLLLFIFVQQRVTAYDWYVAHDREKVVSVHGLCAPDQVNSMQCTIWEKQSLYMDLVYRSRKMTCRSRWGKSSLRAWTLYTGLGQWYVAHDEEKQCPNMDFVYRSRTMVCSSRSRKSSLCTWILCTDLEHWYLAQGAEKVVSLHGLCVPVYDNGIQLMMGKKQSLYMDFVYRSRKMVCSAR